jgi:hypothetical protein
MKVRMRVWVAFFMLAVFALVSVGATHGAAAHTLSAPLPPVKQPSSARFDFSGFIKSSDSKNGDFNIGLNGGGAISGQNLEEDLTLSLSLPNSPDLPPSLTGPMTVTTSIKLIDGKYYFKFSGSEGGEDQWYYSDITDTLGLGTGMMGTDPTGLTGLNADYQDAFTVTQVGKEDVNGPTTKYRIDIDVQKLLSDVGGSATDTADLGNFKLGMFMWVGDNDQYLHKLTITGSGSSNAGGTQTSLSMELNLTFRDFDTPITITAPPNAQKFDASALGGLTNTSFPGGSTLIGMPTSIGAGVATGMPRIGAGGAGMPRTGSHAQADLPMAPLVLAALLSIALGTLMLRYGRQPR